MDPNKLSKETLTAYFYDVSTLELAKKKLDKKYEEPKAVLEHNDTIIQGWTKPEPPVYLTELPKDEKLRVGDIVICFFIGLIGGIVAFLLSFPLCWFCFMRGYYHYCDFHMWFLLCLFRQVPKSGFGASKQGYEREIRKKIS